MGWVRRRLPVLIVALVLGVIAVVLTRPRAEPMQRDPACTPTFPVQLFPNDRTSLGLRDMLVCSNGAGTATLIRNQTRAVWVLDDPAPLYRARMSEINRSFLDLVAGEPGAIPGGATVVVVRPAATTAVTVDPVLTLEQLAHDQLASALDRVNLRDAALTPGAGAAHRALGACMTALVAELDDPATVLSSEHPETALDQAADRVAERSTSACVTDWLEAKVDSGMPSVDIRPFAFDVGHWGAIRSFVARVESAGATYRDATAAAMSSATTSR